MKPAADAVAADGGALLRSLFLAHPDALLVVGCDGVIVRANPAAARLLGYAEDELVGLGVDALVPQASRAGHAGFRAAYAESPRARPMGLQLELLARRKDGIEVAVEIALSPLHEQGQAYVVAAIRDVAGYPRVQQALRRARYSEHLAQLSRLAVDAREPHTMLEQGPAIAADALQADAAMVYLLDRSGLEFSLVGGVGLCQGDQLGMRVPNRADTLPGHVLRHGHTTIGPTRGALAARTDPDAGFALPATCCATDMQSTLAVPLSDRGRRIGSVVICCRQACRFGDDELHFLESLSNLLATSLQRAHSEQALKHAQQLESVGQLTGGIAHDFNNLLTIIQGNLQVLEELPALTADAHARHLVGAAVRAARRGAELTGKLLAFSRRQVLQPSTIDVSQMLHSLADMLRRTLDQRIRIEVAVAADCPPVRADAGQLESALLNIAINARDAMREGGRLQFSAQPCPTLPLAVRDSLDDPLLAHDGFVAIAIDDSGCGMPEAVKRRAFEPFFTTKEVGRGTGLGLSTVYGFARQSRGAVTLDSAPGVGTTLTLYLPQQAACEIAAAALDGRSSAAAGAGPAADAAPAQPGVDAPLAPGLRVLLVEDDAEVRDVMRRFLDTLGCHTTPLANAEQALQALQASQTGASFDVLLSDIALGAGVRGTELAALAQQGTPQLAVLLMSGYSAELLDADREAPLDWELLRKPCSRGELAAALARALAARR